jgi:hypothetical protein
MTSPLINEKFRVSVESHLFGNLLIKDTRSPLILGIFGPPGEGKTFQLDYICKSLKITQTIISPGELESENAGHPAQLLRKLYIEAGTPNLGTVKSEPKVLVINDIDTVLGNWGALVQYTVNRQILYGQLMAFCDFPCEVSGHSTNRVPIIITGNNPKILYQPLLRSGRMRMMPWVPDITDKLPIVARIFPGLLTSDISNLVSLYPNQPISFWSDIDARYWENRMAEWLNERSRDSLLNDIASGVVYAMKDAQVTLSELKSLAMELSANDVRNKSYIVNPDGLGEQ